LIDTHDELLGLCTPVIADVLRAGKGAEIRLQRLDDVEECIRVTPREPDLNGRYHREAHLQRVEGHVQFGELL